MSLRKRYYRHGEPMADCPCCQHLPFGRGKKAKYRKYSKLVRSREKRDWKRNYPQ